MPSPSLTIDLDKIEHNARTIVGLCAQHGLAVTGVTKGVCGHPEVARAMLRGGVSSIGESHVKNIRRLRAAGIATSYVLLRLPPLTEVDEVVEVADVSLNSELSVLAALSEAALGRGQLHDVIVMVDLGDLREGVLPGDLVPFVRAALRLRGVRIRGIGTNLACFGAVAPSTENMTRLVDLACQTEQSLGITLDCVSAANSSGLELIAAGHMPRRVNHARIGEAILLGRETLHRRPWPGTFQDAFLLRTEVLELRRKPSLPAGERCEDAFGKHPAFEDRGEVLHALLNIGREDVEIEGLTPLDRGITILGASSDYLVVDVSTAEGHVRVGGEIAFAPAYGALLAAMTSEYVEKHALRGASRLGGRDSRAGGAA